MKKKFDIIKSLGKKNTILAIVALVLVMMTAIGTSFSWIEEVSQVEFNSNSGQETPLHVGKKVLKAEAEMKQNDTAGTVTEIDLGEYFNESGDMHLSPCYGDGDNFYFPVQKTSTGSISYRTGTKDDANVNYLSATFKVKSSNANTAYWFEKVSSNDFITFKNSSGNAPSNTLNNTLKQYLRVSVTVDGNTNVYAYNSNGTYTTVSSNATSSKTGRSLAKYMYSSETPDDGNPVNCYRNSTNGNVTNKPNQGAYDGTNAETKNLDGNTLFKVNKYDTENKKGTKDVTVKIWYEYNPSSGVRNIRVSNLNLKITSAWAKIRRIYVKDETVHQQGYDSAKWLGTYSATLHWGLKNDLENKHWPLTKVSGSDIYYADIPAVYNNADVVFFRCAPAPNENSDGYGEGDNDKIYPNTSLKYWNYWNTKFPDTFHSEVYTIYSTDFGTWDESDAKGVYIVNSCDFSNLYDYMWDSNSVINASDVNAKVVKNANWPGIEMTTKMNSSLKLGPNNNQIDSYAFFYNSDYDRVVFNDGDYEEGQNHEYQTQDLWLTSNQVDGTFDMATLTWFHTNPKETDWRTKMPTYSGDNTYLYSNISTGDKWKKTRFAYDGEYDTSDYGDNAFKNTSSTNMLCKIYNKVGTTSDLNDFECKLCYNGTWYGAYKNGDQRVWPGNGYTLGSDGDHDKNLILKDLKGKTVYRIYFTWDNGNPRLTIAEGEKLPE